MNDTRHPAGAPGQQPSYAQPQPQAPRPGIAPMPQQPLAAHAGGELDPIELVEDELLMDDPAHAAPAAMPQPIKSKIKAFGQEAARKEHAWKRTPAADGTGACRVKTFHAKYSDQGMEHLDDVINEWLDSRPGVEVKFVTSTVNTFEGKIREPALVLNLWY